MAYGILLEKFHEHKFSYNVQQKYDFRLIFFLFRLSLFLIDISFEHFSHYHIRNVSNHSTGSTY